MRTITEIKIWSFLSKYSDKLRNKTNIYNDYYDDVWEVDIQSITSLSDNELYKLEEILDIEKTYLK